MSESSTTAILPTPFGRIRLVASESALTGVGWAEGEAVDRDVTHPVLRRAADELARFSSGELREFSVPVSLDGVSGFYRHVLETLRDRVPFGRTVTYGELAELSGRPGAARAVGTAMNRNPVPIFVPCHRVLAAGGIGGFGPGVDKKRRLLALEGVAC